jgi:hypothetical protein
VRESIAGVHFVFNTEKFLAEAAGGVERGEIIWAKAAAVEERDSESVADGHGDSGAGCGREVHGAGFFANADVEGNVAGFSKRGTNISSEGDDRRFEAFEGFKEADDFFSFAAIGNGKDGIATCEHAKIAMQSFGGMQEKGGGAGAGESGGNFSADQSGFANASDGHAAFASEKEIDGFFEGGIESREDVLDGLRFDFEDAAGGFEAHA